jgi:hypothetical protein
MFLTKVVEKIKTHILCSITFFRKSHRVYDIMSKNLVATEGPQMTSQHGACTRPRAWVTTCTHAPAYTQTHTHTQISNTYCFSIATMIREHASVLSYAYIARLVFVTCCAGSCLCDWTIIRSEESFRARACVYDCVI